MESVFARRMANRLRSSVPRMSYYRMIRSRSFDELCRFYESGVGISSWEQFAELAGKLEATYAPGIPEGTATPESSHSIRRRSLMNNNGDYQFANLSDNRELIGELQSLERRLSAETGQSITLIAYSHEENSLPDDNCRAGLDD